MSYVLFIIFTKFLFIFVPSPSNAPLRATALTLDPNGVFKSFFEANDKSWGMAYDAMLPNAASIKIFIIS